MAVSVCRDRWLETPVLERTADPARHVVERRSSG
jgi:hypothetical protein